LTKSKFGLAKENFFMARHDDKGLVGPSMNGFRPYARLGADVAFLMSSKYTAKAIDPEITLTSYGKPKFRSVEVLAVVGGGFDIEFSPVH
jgi:hypothetical protein